MFYIVGFSLMSFYQIMDVQLRFVMISVIVSSKSEMILHALIFALSLNN